MNAMPMSAFVSTCALSASLSELATVGPSLVGRDLHPFTGIRVHNCRHYAQTSQGRVVEPKGRILAVQRETSGPATEKQARENNDEESLVGSVVQEKVDGELVRRYCLNKESGVWRVEEVAIDRNGSVDGYKTHKNKELSTFPFNPPKAVLDFVLPAGFPDTVSSDYLRYMLWQFATNVTGWTCSTLVTSSLFKAVGVDGGAGSAAAATAAMKWVSKDGLGSFGRFIIGGRFGRLFDEDPKQWRMYADFIGSAGSIFELATPFAPGSFLLLASLGSLTKAVGKGLKDPSFRVIQNHFAVADNLGDVAAKEEVWRVTAQLLGLGVGVVLLATPGVRDSYWELVLTWTLIRSLHLWLRYQSLSTLCLSTINFKRAVTLIRAHIEGSPLPGCVECNKLENVLIPWQWMQPCVRFGCSLGDLVQEDTSAAEVEELLKLYDDEDYVLALYPNTVYGLEARVLFKEGATSITMVRSLWQTSWLLSHSDSITEPLFKLEINGRSTSLEATVSGHLQGQKGRLTASLHSLQQNFISFLTELEGAGWDLEKIAIKVPSQAPTLVQRK